MCSKAACGKIAVSRKSSQISTGVSSSLSVLESNDECRKEVGRGAGCDVDVWKCLEMRLAMTDLTRQFVG